MDRIIAELQEQGFAVGEVIINNVVEEVGSEFLETRKAMQQSYIKEIVDRYGAKMGVNQLPLLPLEAKGINSLMRLKGVLFP